MDWRLYIGIIAGVMPVAISIPYIRSMFYGTTRPNVVTYILWIVVETITLLAQFSSGASWSAIFIIALIIPQAYVVYLCYRGYGYKKYGLIDKVCLVLAILAIILWLITGEPITAIILSVLADFIATLPTVIKTYREPHSEPVIPWFLIVIAAILSVFSSTKLDLANLLFPIYVIMIDGTVTGIAFFGQLRQKQ